MSAAEFRSTRPLSAAYTSTIPIFGVLDMFAKVAVGLVAAIAVAGTGVYFAQSGGGECKHGCPISRMLNSSEPASTQPASTEPASTVTGSPCCILPLPSDSKPAPNMSLAACAGSATMISTTSKTAAPHACCADE